MIYIINLHIGMAHAWLRTYPRSKPSNSFKTNIKNEHWHSDNWEVKYNRDVRNVKFYSEKKKIATWSMSGWVGKSLGLVQSSCGFGPMALDKCSTQLPSMSPIDWAQQIKDSLQNSSLISISYPKYKLYFLVKQTKKKGKKNLPLETPYDAYKSGLLSQ